MCENTGRSKELLNKVYDQLDSIDMSKLSLRELSDFLEVVQKGRFLETAGQIPPYGLGGCFGFGLNQANSAETEDKKEE